MSKKTKRIIMICLVLILLLGAAGYTVILQPLLTADKWIYKENTVKSGEFTVGVTESGTVEYGETTQVYDLNIETDDDEEDDDDEEEDEDGDETTYKYLKVDTVNVATGQRIQEGDAILSFTEDSVKDVRRNLQGYLTDTKIALAEAKTEYNKEAISAEETYNLSVAKGNLAGGVYSAAVTSAQNSISLLEVENEQLTQEITDLQESIEDAQEDFDDAEEDYIEVKNAFEATGTSNQHVAITFESKYKTAKEAYDKAREKLDQIYEDIEDKQETISDNEQEISNAKQKLSIDIMEDKQTKESDVLKSSVASVQYTADLASLQETVDEAEEDVEDAQYKLDAFEEFVRDGTIYAKGSGIITSVGYEAGDYLTEAGTVVSFTTEEDMTISVDVSQEDITSLTVGDSVEIIFTAYEDEMYEGIITSITMTSTSESSTTVSYPITIQILGDTSKLYGGMTADVTFITDSIDNTLFISKKAIVEENGKEYVYIKKSGEYVLQQIKTGLSNGQEIEILSGLSENDTYYIASKVSSTKEVTDTSKENNTASETVENEETLDNNNSNGMQEGMPQGMPSPGEMGGMPQ